MSLLRNKSIPRPATFVAFCLMAVLAACNGNGADSDYKKDSLSGKERGPHQVSLAGEKQCYNYFVNGDTIILTLKWLDANSFTGSMVYRLKEKDSNIGTLQGHLKDSILLADYQFSSEGVTSTREVAFKKMEDYIVEGFGEVRSDSSGFRFANVDSLSFDMNIKLHQVTCL